MLNYYSSLSSVYILTDDAGEAGGSNQNAFLGRLDVAARELLFSRLVEPARSRAPKAAWQGGLRESNFNPRVGMGGSSRDARVVSAALRVAPPNRPERTRTLVFNITERHLASLFAGAADTGGGRMYIVDDAGAVISASDQPLVGTRAAALARVPLRSPYGSFVSPDGATQTLYYRLATPGWVLVREIPLALYSGEILRLRNTLVAVWLASLLAIFVISVLWLSRIIRPLGLLAGRLRDMSAGRLGLTIEPVPRNELALVIERFNEMSRSIVELIARNEQMQREKRELEIGALQAQINPHFIYNTLNMIKWMAAMQKAGNIVDAVVALSNILTPVFRDSGTTFTLREELAYLGNYVQIMDWRFGGGITFASDIAAATLERRVPKFILQPLIENAILYGMPRPRTAIEIRVSALETADTLVVAVDDSGVGMPEEKRRALARAMEEGAMDAVVPHGSIGIPNVDRRIRLYGAPYGVGLESSALGGTRVVITLPLPAGS